VASLKAEKKVTKRGSSSIKFLLKTRGKTIEEGKIFPFIRRGIY
jgi:hypothetical protein